MMERSCPAGPAIDGVPKSAELKVVLLGVPSVGKTSLFNRFINESFSSLEPMTPVGSMCCGRRRIVCDGCGEGNSAEVGIVLWDTAGDDRFQPFSCMYYKGSSAVILCYDLSDYTTLIKSAFWISDLSRKLPDAALFLCGCKFDLLSPTAEFNVSGDRDGGGGGGGGGDHLSRYLNVNSVNEFARQNSIPEHRLFFVSARTGQNVLPMFEAIAASCSRQAPAVKLDATLPRVVIDNAPPLKKPSSCFCM